MGIANLILLVVGLISQIFLWSVLYRHRVYWQYPFFFAYITYAAISTVALLGTNGYYRFYYYVFWANEAGLNLLAILALHEVFRRVFFGFYAQFGWFRMLFPAAVGLIILFAFWGNTHSHYMPDNPLMRLVLAAGFGINLIQVGLFCLFIVIARTFNLRWRFAPLGIILGFTLSGMGSAGTYWARSEFGTTIEKFLEYVPPMTYLFAIAIWLDAFFFRPELGPGSFSAVTLRQLAGEIRQDAMILKKIMEKLK